MVKVLLRTVEPCSIEQGHLVRQLSASLGRPSPKWPTTGAVHGAVVSLARAHWTVSISCCIIGVVPGTLQTLYPLILLATLQG